MQTNETETTTEEVWCNICCIRVLKDNDCIGYYINDLEKTHLWECPSCWLEGDAQ
jgi:hypothetical protein